MKNRGFTLIELLAVISLLSLLMIIVLPNVIEQKEKKEKEISESKKKIVYVDAGNYVRNHDYVIKEGNIFCINVNTLIDEGYNSVDVSELKNKIVKISVDSNDNFMYSMVDDCTNVNE